MKRLELSLPTLAENVALDEALLESAEADDAAPNVLRIWESPEIGVVLGRSSPAGQETRLEKLKASGARIVRRTSGGAAVVVGPGCLMYSVILRVAQQPGVFAIDVAHKVVLETMVAALTRLVPGVAREGTSDLAWNGRKISGNSLQVKRRNVLYHGTLLYDFPLDRVAELLDFAPRQPAYRAGRGHRDFVTNFPASGEAIRQALRAAWAAEEPLADWPVARTAELVAEKYGRDDWTFAR
ncbi:MAG TPA: lipoate--protein ligase family protein [Pirellulales bacterium]